MNVPQRCGYVAILGAPNAGKSTLLNQLVGQKISIVTPKVQTTRTRLRGLCTEGNAQLIFVDTPGIFKSERKFEKTMVEEAWAGAADADVLLVLIDAEKGLNEDTQGILSNLGKRKGARVFLALNKVDAVNKPFLISLATACSALGDFERIFMISALSGDGVDDVRRHIAEALPEGPWLYPEDHVTDASLRDIAAELTREKLFLKLRQELPYSLKVETDSWEEQKNGNVKVLQTIVVERESQKKIVIGDKGATLKSIGISARKAMEELVGGKVHLELFVKVDEKWKDR